MKKLAFLFTAFILLGAFTVSCSSDKKKKLTANTATIIIDPAELTDLTASVIADLPGSSIEITGRISSDTGAVIQQWIIDPGILGTINGSTAAFNTNKVVYAVPSGVNAEGYIRAHWNGLTKDVKVAIGTCAVSGGGGISTGTIKLYLFDDEFKSGLNNFWFWNSDQSGVTVSTWSGGYESAICFRYTYVGNSAVWNGIAFVNTSGSIDASDYAKLVFYVKGEPGTTSVDIQFSGVGGSTSGDKRQTFPVTTNWEPQEIIFDDPIILPRNSSQCPFIVIFDDNNARTVYIDNVYLEKQTAP